MHELDSVINHFNYIRHFILRQFSHVSSAISYYTQCYIHECERYNQFICVWLLLLDVIDVTKDQTESVDIGKLILLN